MHSKTPGSAVTWKRVVGAKLHSGQRWPGNQSSWQIMGQIDPILGHISRQVDWFSVIVDPEWSLTPTDPFPGHADPVFFRVWERVLAYLIHIGRQVYAQLYSVGMSSQILHMEGEVFLEKGNRGLVPCRTDIEVNGVVWVWILHPHGRRWPSSTSIEVNGLNSFLETIKACSTSTRTSH